MLRTHGFKLMKIRTGHGSFVWGRDSGEKYEGGGTKRGSLKVATRKNLVISKKANEKSPAMK